MVIKKKKDTFNDYSVELSWGQLNAIYRALEQDHADPLADELFAELGWYLQNVPGPGEDEEEYKEAKDAEKEAMQAGQEMGEPGREGQADIGQEIGAEGPEGTEGPIEAETEEAPEAGEPAEPAEFEGPPSEADQFLEAPPAR